MKPHIGALSTYEYFENEPDWEKMWCGVDLPTAAPWIPSYAVTHIPEAMGFGTKSRTGPAGSTWNLWGASSNDVNQYNLASYGFGDVHSAEWVLPIQKTHKFWLQLGISLKLEINEDE